MRGWRRTWPLIVGALALLVAGCAAGATTPQRGPDLAMSQVLRFGMPAYGAPDINLDPDVVADSGTQAVIDLLYDPLVTLDPQMGVEDWGAGQVDLSADGLTYTFHLRARQGFADDTPVTALDYAYSMNRALNPCLASPVGYYLFAIKDAETFANENCLNGVFSANSLQTAPLLTTLIGNSISVPDPATLVVTLAQPASYFLSALTHPVDAALNPAAIGPDPTSERWMASMTTGTDTSGMFALTAWDHAGGKLMLKPNPHWWGLSADKKPYLREIDITLYPYNSYNSDDLLSAYQAGQLDLAQPESQDLSAAQTMRDFHRVPLLSDHAIIMDWTKAPYNNQDARQALCLAINRDALNQQIYSGEMLPTWHIVPRGMPGYNPALTGPDGVTNTQGAPAAARAHWQAYLQSLHGAKPPDISFSYISYSITQGRLAQALAQQWQSVLGVTVQPREIVPPDTYLLMVPFPLPLAAFDWSADYPDPQDFLSLLTTGAQYNPGGVSVPAADQMIQQADALSNPAQRDALYEAAEQLYVSAVAWCPLFQETSGYLLRGRVKGWQMDGRGLTPNDAWLATYIART